MTGYLALAVLFLLLTALVLALEPGHHRAVTFGAVDALDRDRVDHELAVMGARADDRSLSRATGLLAAANQATPWHRTPLGADEVDLAR